MTLSETVVSPASCFRLLPDKHMVRMIIELVLNPYDNAYDNKQSKLRRLKNSIFQGPVLTFLLFNFYSTTYPPRFPESLSTLTFINLALLRSSDNWKTFEKTSSLEIGSQVMLRTTFSLIIGRPLRRLLLWKLEVNSCFENSKTFRGLFLCKLEIKR